MSFFCVFLRPSVRPSEANRAGALKAIIAPTLAETRHLKKAVKMSDLSQRFAKLPPEQRAHWARCFHPSGNFTDFPLEELNQTIPERFEKMVRLHPHKQAIKIEEQSLTYEELNQTANRLAHYLRQRSGGGAERIALLVDHDAPSIAAMFGILKAGKTCVLLEATLPPRVLAALVEDCQAAAIAACGDRMSAAIALVEGDLRVINVDEVASEFPSDDLGEHPPPDQLAFILYTSGSTGRPKGIMVTHRNMLFRGLRNTRAWHICSDDRICLLPSLMTAWGLQTAFDALLNGSSLALFNIKRDGLSQLADWLRQERITICTAAPAVFREFAKTFAAEMDLPLLRLIRLSGEAIRKTDVELYKRQGPRQCLLGLYLASTESGLLTQYFIDRHASMSGEFVPVGYAADGVEILVLNDAREPLGANVVGEIAVRGRYLFSGYWRNPELTQSKLQPDFKALDQRIYLTGDFGRFASDGCLEYLGRKDFLVKIRGYRVELGEVEEILRSCEGVREAAVLHRSTGGDEGRLVAYFVCNGAAPMSPTSLRHVLQERLPDYMIPSAFILLDAMPTTATGKIDRSALPELDETRPELDLPYVQPRTPLEKQLAKIWREVLAVDSVGIHDNFFDLGGHSLLATQIISRMRAVLRIEIPMRTLFENPTVEGWAMAIAEMQCQQVGMTEMSGILAELESISDEEAENLVRKETTGDE